MARESTSASGLGCDTMNTMTAGTGLAIVLVAVSRRGPFASACCLILAFAALLAASPLAQSACAQNSAAASAPKPAGKVPKNARRPAAIAAPGRVVPAPPPPGDRPESVSVVPGPQYRATAPRKWFVGDRYRAVWTTPIRVPVLDLERYAGGLTPIYPGGGLETTSLHMHGADGIEYVLRSVDKRQVVPQELQGTILQDVAQDETSAGFPTGALVVAPLLTAAGVLHVAGSLVVIPDDPRLGAYREEFAGMLAEMEPRPRTADGEDAFADASKVENTTKVLEDATHASVRIDARAYLTARLMDMYIGDWDRGPTQWRWARWGSKAERIWEPIPLDRDWAFARNNGILNAILRLADQRLTVYDHAHPPTREMLGLMTEEWQLDRRLLQEVEQPVFDSTARWLQGVLTDSVIGLAVAQMPGEEQAIRGAWLAHALRQRRAELPEIARRYYLRMADGADVHTATEPTVVDIDRRPDTVDIRFRLRGAQPGDPYFERRFARRESNEVRLYLDGGPDSITVRGAHDDILVRVITAADGDVLVDSSQSGTGGTNVYDGWHPLRLVDAHSIDTDHRRWSPPPNDSGPLSLQVLVRDDGSQCLAYPWAAGNSDVGLAVGGVLTCSLFGFRRLPFELHQRLIAAFTSATTGGLLDYLGQVRPTGSEDLWSLRMRASTADYTRYFGIGDATPLGRPERYFEAHQQYYELAPAFTLAVAPHATLTLGPDLRYWDTGRTTATYLGLTDPYGLGAFGSVSAVADAVIDTRDTPALATRGVLVNIGARGVPGWWTAFQSYGQLHGVASTYLTAAGLPLSPTLALRAGGEKIWGTAPYQDLAHIGAQTVFDPFTVRGYFPDRFAGQASAFGTVQLEVTVAHPKLIVPAELGLVGFNDIGRVFASGDPASVWHNGTGGGIWTAWLQRTVAGSALMVHGSDGTRIYVGVGTGF